MEIQQWVSFALLSNYEIFLVLTFHGTENSLKVFSVAMETQQWFSCALLSNYEIFLVLTFHGTKNSLKVFSVGMEMHQWASFALLSNYKLLLLLTLHGTENSLKVFSVAMEMQQWAFLALLPNYKIFLTVLNNIGLQVKCPSFCQVLTQFTVLQHSRESHQYQISRKFLPFRVAQYMLTDRRKGTHDEANRRFSRLNL